MRYNFKKRDPTRYFASAGQVSFGRGLWATQSVREVSTVFQSGLVLFDPK